MAWLGLPNLGSTFWVGSAGELIRREVKSLWHQLCVASDWENKGPISKLTFPLELIVIMARDLSVPLVDEERWRRGVCSTAVVGAPQIILYKFGTPSQTWWGVMPAWSCLLLLMVPVGLFIYCRLDDAGPPKSGVLVSILLALGFASSCVWTDLLCTELVSGLEFLGLSLGVSRSIIGLTVLAWGNSIGDLVADTALARAGNPKMGAAGCFGGPLFNMCVGTGVALVVSTASKPTGKLCLPWDKQVPLGLLFLLSAQLISLLYLPAVGFRLTKRFGLALVLYYLLFLARCQG